MKMTLPTADAIKAIRRNLKNAYPGIQFQVKKAPNFSLSSRREDPIHITWFGNPKPEDVDAIASKYYDSENVSLYHHTFCNH